MDFAEFIAPMAVETFMADHFGRRPVISVGNRRALACCLWSAGGIAGCPAALDRGQPQTDPQQPAGQWRSVLRAAQAGKGPRRGPREGRDVPAHGGDLVGDHGSRRSTRRCGGRRRCCGAVPGTAGANIYCSFEGIRPSRAAASCTRCSRPSSRRKGLADIRKSRGSTGRDDPGPRRTGRDRPRRGPRADDCPDAAG